MLANPTIHNALTIAGSDSGGGAGIQADLKTFSALGVYGASVITALTAQSTCEMRSVEILSPEFIRDQLEVVLADIKIDAVKTGMLATSEIVDVVAACLAKQTSLRLVVDPVMVSKTGNCLLNEAAVASLKANLLPLTEVFTPNLPEASVLLGKPEPSCIDTMRETAQALLTLGPKTVLLKGGHLASDQCVDIFYDGTEFKEFHSQRIGTVNTHGTGCSLASAIAAGLAKGESPLRAVAEAKAYITSAIEYADQLNVGAGHGPVHHFHAMWKR